MGHLRFRPLFAVLDNCTLHRAVRTDDTASTLDNTTDDMVCVYPRLAVDRYIANLLLFVTRKGESLRNIAFMIALPEAKICLPCSADGWIDDL